jgi:hypothetical protein
MPILSWLVLLAQFLQDVSDADQFQSVRFLLKSLLAVNNTEFNF